MFVRLVERMRRSIAHEYGLPLSRVLPAQTFVSCFIGKNDKQVLLLLPMRTHPDPWGPYPNPWDPTPDLFLCC